MNQLIPSSMRGLQETNATDDGGGGDFVAVNGSAIEINGMTYNAFAIAGIVVAISIVLYMVFSLGCQRQKTMEELRLTHVRTGMAWGLIGFTFISVILSAVIMVLAAQGVFDNSNYEVQWNEVGGAANWCEATNPQSLVKNPANTMSNIGFIVAGVVMLGLAIEDAHALKLARQSEKDPNAEYYEISYPSAKVGILRMPSISILWGLMSIYLGIASGVYHAKLVSFWGYMDIASLYAVLSVPILYDLMRFTPWSKRPIVSAILIYVLEAGIIVVTILAIVYTKTLEEEVVPIMIGGMVGADILLRFVYIFLWPRKSKYNSTGIIRSLMAVGVGVMTVVLRLLEQNTNCPDGVNPNSYLQVHAVFHICAAEAILLSYILTRSETLKLNSNSEKSLLGQVQPSRSIGQEGSMEVVIN